MKTLYLCTCQVKWKQALQESNLSVIARLTGMGLEA